MKKIIVFVCVSLLVIACNNDKKGSMIVKGEVKGLKTGTLYLQKMVDSTFVAIDSVLVNGSGLYTLSDQLETPEIYYLSLGKNNEKKILFFGEKGTITVNTLLERFTYSAKVSGSKNHELLEKYQEMTEKFNNKRLDLIKAQFLTQSDSLKRDSLVKLSNNLVKRRYFYTTQFAVNNADKEIAPYLAITELFNANVSLLDTVNNSLTENVKASKYGKKLNLFIKEIKEKNK